MVPVLARMSVVIKAQHETSVMTGNYEMGYVCGLLCRLAGITPPPLETPLKLQEKMMAALEGYNAADEREKNIIRMLKYYKPDDNMDDQVKELFSMGLEKTGPGKDKTKRSAGQYPPRRAEENVNDKEKNIAAYHRRHHCLPQNRAWAGAGADCGGNSGISAFYG